MIKSGTSYSLWRSELWFLCSFETANWFQHSIFIQLKRLNNRKLAFCVNQRHAQEGNIHAVGWRLHPNFDPSTFVLELLICSVCSATPVLHLLFSEFALKSYWLTLTHLEKHATVSQTNNASGVCNCQFPKTAGFHRALFVKTRKRWRRRARNGWVYQSSWRWCIGALEASTNQTLGKSVFGRRPSVTWSDAIEPLRPRKETEKWAERLEEEIDFYEKIKAQVDYLQSYAVGDAS